MEAAPRVAVTPRQRLRWFDQKTFGVSNFVGSLPGAAWQTFFDRPREAGPHWEGFAERDGVSLSTNTVSNALEAGRMEPVFPLNQGLAMFVEWTVVAPDRNGELRPAYAPFRGLFRQQPYFERLARPEQYRRRTLAWANRLRLSRPDGQQCIR